MQPPRHADNPRHSDDVDQPLSEGKSPAGDNRYSLQSLIDCVPAYLWVKDTQCRFTIANKPIALDYGLTSPDEMIGLDDFDLHDRDMAERFQAIERDLIRTGRPVLDQEEFVVDNAGVKKWRLTSKVPLRNAHGIVTGLIGISRDITQAKLAANLREGQSRIVESIATGASLDTTLGQVAVLIESQTNGLTAAVFLVDDGRAQLRLGGATSMPPDLVQAVETTSAHDPAAFWGSTVVDGESVFVPDSTLDPRFETCRDTLASRGFRSCWSIPIRSAHGGILGMILICGPSVRVPTSSESQLIDLMIRTSAIAIERKQAEDHIQFMATHDSLTKLPNRSVLKDRLSHALLQAEECDHQVSVVFVDLDNFKFINDSLGHRAGDDLLRHIAGRIVSSVRTTDTVVRVGGDEFVLVLSVKPQDNETVAGTIQAVRTALQESCQIGQHSVSVTSSMGVASYPEDGTDVDMLLAHADAAMYRAKDSGRDAVEFFTPDLNAQVHEKLVIHDALRHALARSEFTLHYQPQVDVRTGQILAFEALLRWHNPTLGAVTPDTFIPIAEETGAIVPIGDWVLHEACRQNKAWQDAGLPSLLVSVNVSARQFRDKLFVDQVRSALEESRLDPQYLELELTERLIMQDVERAVATMKQLRCLGVSLSIDDFGTGYSSLSALKTFPVGRLKIDRSFITDLTRNESNRAVAGAIISLGQKLNLKVIAEGVETLDQADFLRDNHCDEMQGFHFSRPLPPDEAVMLLRERPMSGRQDPTLALSL